MLYRALQVRWEMSDNLTKTLIQRLKECFEAKIAEGYQIVDIESYSKLRKMAMQELKLGDGHYGVTNKALNQILKERNIVLPNIRSTETLGSFRIETEKPDIPEPTPAPITDLPERLELVTAPAQQTAPIIWDESKKKEYESTMQSVFGDFLGTVYIKFGIIEGDEPKQEKMTIEQFKKEANDFGTKVGDCCYNHHVNLPMWIELLGLISIGFMVFVMPVINQLFFKMKLVEPDKDLPK